MFISILQMLDFVTCLLLLAFLSDFIALIGALLVLAIVTNPNIFCNFVLGIKI